MYCTQCGVQIQDNDRFCSQCGKATSASSAGVPPSPYQPEAYVNPRQYRPLARTRDGWLGGVCAGLARYWGMDPALVRILFVGLALCPLFPAIVPYIVCWVIMPMDPLPEVQTNPMRPPSQVSVA